MTTSSIYEYQLTRNNIITAALRKLGVLSEGQEPSAQNYADAEVSLNTTLAQLRVVGMPLWARVEHTFTPVTTSYNIGIGQTLNIPAPIMLLQAIRTDSSGSKIDMDIVARQDFNTLPGNSTGIPLKVNYQHGVNSGVISFWPTPSSSNTATVTIVYQRPFQYFTSATDTMDLPEQWYDALIYNLAVKLAPEWSIPLQERMMLKQEAKDYTDVASAVGNEEGSLFLSPTRGG